MELKDAKLRSNVDSLNRHETIPYISTDVPFVCAITIGGSYSGYAFSRAQDIVGNEMDITVQEWNAPSHSVNTYKTPTSFLVGPVGKLEAMGYEAESKYAEQVVDERQHAYFFFGRALLDLEKEGLTMNTPLKDITNRKEMSAIDIFCNIILFFRNHMMKTVKKMNIGVEESDIKWVFTVPAMCSDEASQKIITKAAEMAGISREKVVLALESETALIYCSRQPLSNLEGADHVSVCEVGKKILLLDAGGGKVDFTVFEITKENTLKTLEKTSDWKCGGTCVDICYEDTLTDVVGKDVMDAFCQKCTLEYVELLRNFEMKKTTKISKQQAWITMKMPEKLFSTYETTKNQDINEAIEKSKHNRNMKLEGKKLRITTTLFMEFFSSACERINQNITKLLNKTNVEGLNTIVMVGGFSLSSILQNCIKSNFPSLRIILPHEGDLVVLKGAVLFGHNLSILSERIAKNSYGVASCFKKSDSKQNEFEVYVRKGDVLSFNKVQSDGDYEANRDEEHEMELRVYGSEEENLPKYVMDPGCKYLGTLIVHLPKPITGERRVVNVQMIFGETKLYIKAVNKISNEMISEESFDFPGTEP